MLISVLEREFFDFSLLLIFLYGFDYYIVLVENLL